MMSEAFTEIHRKKRVIYTVNYSKWSPYSGGAQRSTHNLALHMARRGHDVHVICSKSPFETISPPDNLPYTLHWVPLFLLKSRREAFFRPLTAWPVKRIVSRLIDTTGLPVVVHANGEEASKLHKLKKSRRFAFVATPRYSHYPAELRGWPDLSLRNRWQLILQNAKFLHQAEVLHHADCVCPPSEWAATTVTDLLGLDPRKVRSIHNGVPECFLSVQRSSEALKGPLIYFGRLSNDKGVDLLLKAVSRLRSGNPEIWIVGKGEEEGRLISLSEELNLNHRVSFIPWQTQDDLIRLLAGARMALFPSRSENCSLSILSAMAAGIPTISTRVGGTPELIEDRVTGLLVEPESPEPLAKAIEELLNHPETAEELGLQAALHIRNLHTWDEICRKFDTLYDELIGENKLSGMRI